MTKIIIIGKKSFIGFNLKFYLKKKCIIKTFDLNQFLLVKKDWSNKVMKKLYLGSIGFDTLDRTLCQ